jgi:hypothetical protein
LIDAVEHAWTRAAKAVLAEKEKDWSEAFRQWNLVFNGEFPSR